MISVDSLLYEIDQRLNKLATNEHQQIPIEDKLIALNESQTKLIKIKVSTNNIYKLGLDAFKKRYQDLQFLIENPEDHPLKLTLSDKYLNKYIAYIDQLDPKFMFYIDAYVIADKGICKNRVIYTNADLVKHADITILLNDSNFKPSFEYQETIIDIATDELHIYTDGTFEPKNLYLQYIRYPKAIDKEGYVHFDGSDSTDQDCELEDYLKDELLDLTVESLAMFTENISAVQSAKSKETTNE
jgi:hypothetical protein